MRFEVRAQHTTSRVVPTERDGAARAYVRVVSPARPGDAHLVDGAGRSLCGRDAARWRAVTSRRWVDLGEFACAACHREAVRRTARPG